MDNIFRVFMFLLPYGFSIAAYVWIGTKALRLPNSPAKYIALVILAVGLAYTFYRMITTSSKAFADDRFEFIVLIVNVFVLFFASIAITFGEPEENENLLP